MLEDNSICPPLWWIILMSPILLIFLVKALIKRDIATIYTEYNKDGTLKNMWAVEKGEVRDLLQLAKTEKERKS